MTREDKKKVSAIYNKQREMRRAFSCKSQPACSLCVHSEWRDFENRAHYPSNFGYFCKKAGHRVKGSTTGLKCWEGENHVSARQD